MSFKEKTTIHKFLPKTIRGIFEGNDYHSEGDWSGDYLLYDEDALRPAAAWHYVHLHRIRVIVLPVGREFKFPAQEEDFFTVMTTGKIADAAGESGAS